MYVLTKHQAMGVCDVYKVDLGQITVYYRQPSNYWMLKSATLGPSETGQLEVVEALEDPAKCFMARRFGTNGRQEC